nr:MAG: hypothetical protein DIU66_07965 [Bacillota bacterium]
MREKGIQKRKKDFGGHSGGETPVSIPNTQVYRYNLLNLSEKNYKIEIIQIIVINYILGGFLWL